VEKPAQLTPLTTLFFTQLLVEAGLPKGVVNVITSSSSRRVSAPIIEDPRLRKLSFTGSTPVGKQLMAQASENVLRVSMELVGDGRFYEPTVLAGVTDGSAILREEIFGPVLAISTFADEDEAVRLANDTEYGLVSYVYTEDLTCGHRMIDRLETGMMGLNAGVVSNAAAPFGGVKQSGVGREGSLGGIHEYLSTKYTLLPRD